MRSRLVLALTTLAAVVGASLSAVGAPAQAVGSGSISGVVTVPAGYDVRSVQVVVTPANAVSRPYAGSDWTDDAGNFEITGLPSGTYYVGFGTYWSDMNVCNGRDRWWSGAGTPPAGVCSTAQGTDDMTMTGAQSVTVVDGSPTSLGTVPVLSTYPTYQVSGQLVAPPGESTAGVQVELWVDDENYWINAISGGWYRLTSVPVQTLDAGGHFTYTLPTSTWTTYTALRVVDPSHGYAFSFGTGGLTKDSTGLGGTTFGAGSVGLLNLPWNNYPDTDFGKLQLKHEITPVSGSATITGTSEWGRTLTAHSDAVWSAPGTSTEFQWLRNGTVIDGVTGPTYVLNGLDDGFGTQFTVRAVPKGAWAYNGTPIESPAITVTNTTPLNVGIPTVKGAPVVGQKVTATPGAWRPTYPTYTYAYRWFRGNTPIAGATAPTYVVSPADLGQRLSVEVSANHVDPCTVCQPYFTAPGIARSSAGAVVVRPAMPSTWVRKWPAKVGARTAQVGHQVAVGKAVLSTAGTAHHVRVTYQWFVGGKAVRGATRPTLTVKRAWKGRAVVVRVTASAPGHLAKVRSVAFGKAR